MFLLRLLHRSFTRQPGRRSLVAVTVGLSAAVSVAMLGVVLDVGDKINAELTTYGSNIVVQPRSGAVVDNLYETSQDSEATSFLREDEVAGIKTIFWAYNIVDLAPTLSGEVRVTAGPADGSGGSGPTDSATDRGDRAGHADHAGNAGSGADSADDDGADQEGTGRTVLATGTWFDKELSLPTGETTTLGVTTLRSWWEMEGTWPGDDAEEAVVGTTLAEDLGVGVGDTVTLTGSQGRRELLVAGVYTAGDEDDETLYAPLALVQELADHAGQVEEVEVKALTTPENDLSRKAATNPAVLSSSEWETWYCTAYASSISYQIEEVMDGAVAKQVRQVAAVEGSVLSRTQALMVLMTALSLVAAALAVASLTSASLVERTSEFALLKAVGASSASVSRLILAETAVLGVVGLVVGAVVGSGLAQVIGTTVFGSTITMRPMVYVVVTALVALVLLAATASSMRSILRIQPATALHGR